MLFVTGDLVVDQLEAVTQLIDLRDDVRAVFAQHLESLGLVARSPADEFGQSPDVRQRHPGRPEFDAVQQPVDVPGRVDPPAGRVPAHRAGEQALAFIQPQCVHAESRLLGHVADAQAVFAHPPT
jgi:hypothetical protein